MRWKKVVGYEGVYEVSSTGLIRRVDAHPQSIHFRKKRRKYLANGRNKEGYRHVTLCKKGVVRTIAVHRIVALAFHGRPPRGYECAHKDGRPANCNARNLKWVTRKVNHAHKRVHGTHLNGQRSPASKLTD